MFSYYYCYYNYYHSVITDAMYICFILFHSSLVCVVLWSVCQSAFIKLLLCYVTTISVWF